NLRALLAMDSGLPVYSTDPGPWPGQPFDRSISIDAMPANAASGTVLGTACAPLAVDLDNDGDLDLCCPTSSGEISVQRVRTVVDQTQLVPVLQDYNGAAFNLTGAGQFEFDIAKPTVAAGANALEVTVWEMAAPNQPLGSTPISTSYYDLSTMAPITTLGAGVPNNPGTYFDSLLYISVRQVTHDGLGNVSAVFPASVYAMHAAGYGTQQFNENEVAIAETLPYAQSPLLVVHDPDFRLGLNDGGDRDGSGHAPPILPPKP
ncbi:MAG: hypothetical protein R3C12_26410, partial [Planctomycetaceae bacterium]